MIAASSDVPKLATFSKIKEALLDIYNAGFIVPDVSRQVTDYFNPIHTSEIRDLLMGRKEEMLRP